MADENQSVESYRIQELEKELATLKAQTNTLTLGQIKEMFVWLGLPVVVATGVFGAALWQTIEAGTVSAAEERADRKVQEISNAIGRLEDRTTTLAREAEAKFGDIREIAGQADEAARSVRTRSDDARNQAIEAERLITQLRQRLASAPEVDSLLARTGEIADQVAGNPNFGELVTGKVLERFAGAIVAFDRQAGCPVGWELFEEGAGKVVLGAGVGTLNYRGPHQPNGAPSEVRLTTIAYRDQGGAEQHTLTVEEMPSHTHSPPADRHFAWVTYRAEGNINVPSRGDTGGWFDHARGLDTPQKAGGKPDGTTAPHNNMPPYIALYFCKKEG